MAQFRSLPRTFFERPTLLVAEQLLGMRLVRIENGQRLSGIIVETEAYIGEEDQGCHARAGLTPRTKVMYGPPGHAYVYFTYGMHWLLNFVTEPEGFPAAVLIRAIQLEEGQEIVAQRRNGQPPHFWTNGPAKLCQALNIDGRWNGYDLCQPDALLFVESLTDGSPILELSVTTTSRVGLNRVQEPWRSIPWRFVGTPK
ncbi:MAG: DNA-3-methyladenine glycosylase [Anaerolineales bacterium]|nr:DNA-3-methyladenine glycosylase [Anaerolineales bacterium]MCS7248757.1 DNA-3-methyladenine glycosylase [Anaerolineales bacterium]MDW8162570.1 DNA-3-methyladenine glycosylase [Anaerolineales bacterium]MDW8446469.1 DNA-3-methyladenine glycosylase [Anaerolineales bacterium]